MVKFEAVEVGLEPAYLPAVGIHLLLGTFLVLVHLLCDDFRVTIGEESLDAKGSGDPEAMDKGLVLSYVVSSLEE